jgi:hypothetical protein
LTIVIVGKGSPLLDEKEWDDNIFGILGVLALKFAKFMFYISQREMVGSLAGRRIWRVAHVKCIKFHADEHLTPREVKFRWLLLVSGYVDDVKAARP